jgi:MazG family protein
MSDVLGGLSEKLVRRHPHVFGEVQLDTADQVVAQWDELKAAERQATESALSGVPPALPALAYAQTLLRRAAAAGFAWPDRADVLTKLGEELRELDAASTPEQRTEEFGDILINLANYARYLDIDAEEALRLAGHKFRRRFESIETAARGQGRDLKSRSLAEMTALWEQVKQDEPPPTSASPEGQA